MKVGIALECKTCRRTKKPRGRSAPIGLDLCDYDCPGYRSDPLPGDLWPGETQEDFGFPIGPDGWKEE